MSEFLNNLQKFGYAILKSIFNDVELYYNEKNIFTFFKTVNSNLVRQCQELGALFSNLFSKKEIKNYF